MFQRLKGAIDSRIAEEQERQRRAAQSASPQKAPVSRVRNGAAGVPARRQSRQRIQDGHSGPQPDPSEFEPEPEFTIGDDVSEPSRTSTPRPLEKQAEPALKGDNDVTEKPTETTAPGVTEQQTSAEEPESQKQPTVPELPAQVQAKLQRLSKLEEKYGQLLRAYKTAHARVQTIGSFETTLRENTPLTTIAEPAALVEFLNQLNLKADMVMQELKRVTAENTENTKKLETAEKEKADLQDEMMQLKDRMGRLLAVNADALAITAENGQTEKVVVTESEDISSPVKSLTEPISSRVPSFSLFSPKLGTVQSPPKEKSEDFFSYDAEVPRLESELQERETELENLRKQVVSLKGDLTVARESTGGMAQSLESATRELHTLREDADKHQTTTSESQEKISGLEAKLTSASIHTSELELQLKSIQAEKMQMLREHDEKLKKVDEMLERSRKDTEETDKTILVMREKIEQKDAINKDLEDSLAMKLSADRQELKKAEVSSYEKRIATIQSDMDALKIELDSARKAVADLTEKLELKQKHFEAQTSSRVFGFLDNEQDHDLPDFQNKTNVIQYLAKRWNVENSPSSLPKTEVVLDNRATVTSSGLESNTQADSAPPGGGKKKSKNKKKKGKGGQDRSVDLHEMDAPQKVSEDLADADDISTRAGVSDGNSHKHLIDEIQALRKEIEEKEASIRRLTGQLKDQEALTEEIETLRDDLLHQGQEHVEARDKLKTSLGEKVVLQESLDKLEKELAKATTKASDDAELEKAHKDLTTQFEKLKSASSSLQTDLAAAEQLAAGRFKDITDLRELLSKAQPELRNLRNEVTELKAAREELKNKTGALARLEARHEDIKAEMKGLSKRLGDKDAELKDLQRKLEQEASSRRRLEEDLGTAQSDLRYAESRKREADEQAAQTSRDLAAAKEDSIRLKAKFTDLDDQLSSHNKLVAELREELSLKAALHTTSQSMVTSMREQTHELSTQAREASSRAESLEEELAEAQRMLSERTREGQTMRMLLNQSETGTEAKIRDMKDRMEAALEERDRAEEEASLQSRRVMREVEDARAKARTASADLKQAQDERDELQDKQRDWKRKRDELEATAEKMAAEVTETKSAMDRLRQVMDESERQMEDLEKQRNDIRKREDEARERIDRLTKTNKALNDELKNVQQTASAAAARKPNARPPLGSPVPSSSRTSLETLSMRSATPTERTQTPTGPNAAGGMVDYVYLKNVLLQFLEQKDKTHQKQLVPVLGMLLHFDKKDEQKWMSAISAR